MKIMVTGGTGFVGSHTVAELIRHGHQARLLVRNAARVPPALVPFGISDVEVVVGDVTDRCRVEEAATGCQATIHCGSVYSLDPRAADVIDKTNVLGTDTVIRVAHALGHDPIVHVSSFVALIGEKCAVLSPDSEPGTPPGAYFSSKASSDVIARNYQKEGAPVVITYPGSVWGPHDPHLGESCQMIDSILRRLWTITPRGVVSITDVRDLAKLHLEVIEKGRGPRRYIAPAQNITINRAMFIVSSLTGRKLPTVSLPASMLLGPMKLFDSLQRSLTFRLPVNFQEVYCVGLASSMDDAQTRREFGIIPRPLEETFADTIRWMVKNGHLSPRLAGRLGETS
jgi:nucleoside-diphosphate-sugar epimerase